MKLLTRDTDYGIRALIFMSRHNDGVISANELVKALKIPRPFLRKILQKMNKGGILKSYKGRGGGFSLTAKAGKISLKELIEMFQGPVTLNECVFKKRCCPNRGICQLKKKIDNIEREMVLKLELIRIGELLTS